MKKLISYSAILFFLLSKPALSEIPVASAFLDGGNSKVGLILCHGRGKYPTWKVVEPLRKNVNERLHYHTLSIQMPNDDKDFKYYINDFPESYSRIKEAIRFLKQEKGVETIFLMGHSMGGRMASAFLAHNANQPIMGLIIAGCRNNGDSFLNCEENVTKIDLPILDIWGGSEKKDVRAANERKHLQSHSYTQVEIPNANHRFDNHESEFVDSVINWLKAQ